MHVVSHWGNDPDIESIRMSLNCEEHLDNDLYRRTLYAHTPILQEPPEDLDETWRSGVFLNGGGVDEYLTLARSFNSDAADALLDFT